MDALGRTGALEPRVNVCDRSGREHGNGPFARTLSLIRAAVNGVIDQQREEEGVWPPGWASEGRRGSDRFMCGRQSLGRSGGIGEWLGRGALRVATVVVLIGAAFALLATTAAGRTVVAAGASGGRGASATPVPMSIPVPTNEPAPAGSIPIEKVSNGCGGGGASTEPGLQNWLGDSATFRGSLLEPAFTVNFHEACNLHDAAYSGAYVWDSINGGYKDFRGTSREEADDEMQKNMDKLCEAKIPSRYQDTIATCKAGIGHWLIVRGLGWAIYRDRYDLGGGWANTNPGWPLCDIGAGLWNITQTGREVSVSWQHGTSGGQRGSFKGILVTGDNITDDRVVGEYTITDAAGKKIGGGPMTWAIKSQDSFDFNGTGVGGNMKRSIRTTQAAAAPPDLCAKPTTPATTTAQPGAFNLVPGLTSVSNPNANELTITATPAGQGIDDHTGKNGGAGNGGDWKVEYHWAVPTTLVPGKTAAIYLQIRVDSEQPPQPNGYQMGALAPDFAEALPCHYPEQSSCSKTFEYTLHADQAGSKEIGVSIHMLSAEVDFTYRPAGK